MGTLVEKQRIASIDWLRGLVMIFMTFDHTRGYHYSPIDLGDPMDITTTPPEMFFARWITHFCAPVFVFLSGLAAWLNASHNNFTEKQLAGFLLSRGMFLIALEFTLVVFAWGFVWPPKMFYMGVIWGIGVSMIALAVLIWLPFGVLLAVSLFLALGHHVFDSYTVAGDGAWKLIWSVLHQRDVFSLTDSIDFRTSYPVMPMIGLIGAGYCAGWLYTQADAFHRRKWLIGSGLALILFFILLRSTNFYGDPHPFITFADGLMTFMSWLNTTKYPFSALFIAMTVGPGLLLLACAERWSGKLYHWGIVYGRVPLFYYLIHLYVINGSYRLLTWIWPGYKDSASLWTALLATAVILAVLYPASIWFAEFRSRHKRNPLVRMF